MSAGPSRSILISILNWNGSGATLACVQSLLQLDNPDCHTLDIVVIDNGSSPEQWQALQQGLAGERVRLVRKETNLGFLRAATTWRCAWRSRKAATTPG